jgi:hypothetical protein
LTLLCPSEIRFLKLTIIMGSTSFSKIAWEDLSKEVMFGWTPHKRGDIWFRKSGCSGHKHKTPSPQKSKKNKAEGLAPGAGYLLGKCKTPSSKPQYHSPTPKKERKETVFDKLEKRKGRRNRGREERKKLLTGWNKMGR